MNKQKIALIGLALFLLSAIVTLVARTVARASTTPPTPWSIAEPETVTPQELQRLGKFATFPIVLPPENAYIPLTQHPTSAIPQDALAGIATADLEHLWQTPVQRVAVFPYTPDSDPLQLAAGATPTFRILSSVKYEMGNGHVAYVSVSKPHDELFEHHVLLLGETTIVLPTGEKAWRTVGLHVGGTAVNRVTRLHDDTLLAVTGTTTPEVLETLMTQVAVR